MKVLEAIFDHLLSAGFPFHVALTMTTLMGAKLGVIVGFGLGRIRG